MELPNQEKIRTISEKENYQTNGDEIKNKERIFQKNQKVTRDKTM